MREQIKEPKDYRAEKPYEQQVEHVRGDGELQWALTRARGVRAKNVPLTASRNCCATYRHLTWSPLFLVVRLRNAGLSSGGGAAGIDFGM